MVQTAEERWPELEKIASEIATKTLMQINSNAVEVKSKTECHYPAQCILEMVITKLETQV